MIDQQAIEMIIDDKYPEILSEIEVNPYGPGTLEEIVSKEPPKFVFTVPLSPEVDLPDYHTFRKEYNVEPITEDDVQKVIKDIQVRYATAEPSDKPVEDGDLVYINLSGEIIDGEDGSDIEVVKDASLQVVIGGNELDPDDWPYKGFTKELIGLNENDTKELIHSYDDDTPVEKIKGKKVKYTVLIESIKNLVYPDFDDEFVKSLGEYESLEDFKSKITDQLTDKRASDYDVEYHSEVLGMIVKDSTIKYPPQILDEEVSEVIKSLENDLALQKLDLKTYLKTRETDLKTFLDEEIRPAAVVRLERALVLDKVSIAEKIELDKSELQSDVSKTIEELESMQDFAKKPNQEKQELTNRVTINTANRLINTKIFERLKEIATGEFENAGEKESKNELIEENIEADDIERVENKPDDSIPPSDEKEVDQSGE